MLKAVVTDAAEFAPAAARPGDRLGRDGALRGACEGLDQAPPCPSRGLARQLSGPRPSGRARPSGQAGHHRHRADAGLGLHRRAPADRASASPITGATTRWPCWRPSRAMRWPTRWPSCAPPSQPAWRRHRGDPRRRAEPHRRERHRRADAVLARPRQRRLLPAGRCRLLGQPHRLRQHARPVETLRPAAGHGRLAPLGHRLRRRRLPLRPRCRARPRRHRPFRCRWRRSCRRCARIRCWAG